MRSTTLRRSLRGVCVAVAGACLAGCTQQPATEQAQDTHRLFYITLALATLVFVGVEGALLWAIVRYRRRRGEEGEGPQWHGTNRMILLFFLIGTVIVATLYPFGEITLARVQQNPQSPEVIDITGSQWQWSAFYENEGVVVSGKSFVRPLVMEVPVDEPIHIHIVSNDVMHEFFVPAFYFMRNAMPGHPNDFTWTPTRLGTFQGQCAEYCGLGHYQMRFVVRVVTPTDFFAWVKQERKAALSINCPQTSGASVHITAHNISWDTNCIHVPEGTPIQLTITNNDGGIDHNFAIWNGIDTAHQFFASGKFPGVATRTETIPTLEPGRYYFQCNVHGPAMSGVFIVGNPPSGQKGS